MVKNNNNRKNDIENRKHPRFILILSLELTNDDFRIETKTKNISCSGVYCEVDRYIPVQTKLNVNMKLMLNKNAYKVQKTIHCPAKVVRIEPDVLKKDVNYHVAIAFSRIKEEDKDFLIKYIRRKNLKEARELKKIYLKLKNMAARLVELEECHPTAEHFRKVIDRAIGELDAVAHILDFEINELKNLE